LLRHRQNKKRARRVNTGRVLFAPFMLPDRVRQLKAVANGASAPAESLCDENAASRNDAGSGLNQLQKLSNPASNGLAPVMR